MAMVKPPFRLSSVRSPGQPCVILGNCDQDLVRKGTVDTRQIYYLEKTMTLDLIIVDTWRGTPGHEYHYIEHFMRALQNRTT